MNAEDSQDMPIRSRKLTKSKALHVRSHSHTDVRSTAVPEPQLKKNHSHEENEEEKKEPDNRLLTRRHRSKTEDRLVRKDSTCYPFSERHVKKHENNLRRREYLVSTFDEYLEMSGELNHKRAHSADAADLVKKKGLTTRKLSKPEILEARKKKFGRSRSQSNPQLHRIEIDEPLGELKPDEKPIKTFPLTKETEEKPHSSKKFWKTLFKV